MEHLRMPSVSETLSSSKRCWLLVLPLMRVIKININPFIMQPVVDIPKSSKCCLQQEQKWMREPLMVRSPFTLLPEVVRLKRSKCCLPQGRRLTRVMTSNLNPFKMPHWRGILKWSNSWLPMGRKPMFPTVLVIHHRIMLSSMSTKNSPPSSKPKKPKKPRKPKKPPSPIPRNLPKSDPGRSCAWLIHFHPLHPRAATTATRGCLFLSSHGCESGQHWLNLGTEYA